MRPKRRRTRKLKAFFLHRIVSALSFGVAAVFAAGCGQTAAPQPPSLNLPAPVADLSAGRVADRVRLTWTMPRRTTDRLLLKAPQLVHICRKVGDGPCATAADVSFPPEKPVTYEDVLPSALASGTPRLLTYVVEVRNRRGRSAGDSNPAYSAAGAAPPGFADFRGAITAKGVLLQWRPAALANGSNEVKIDRTLLSTGGATAEAKKSSPIEGASAPPKGQALVVPLLGDRDPGRALDPDAAFDQRYSYEISRAATVSVGGKSVQIEGPASAQIVVDTKDVFPPKPPTGLAAVADPEQGAIDLSWSPNTEKDLAGYAVYRREDNGKPQRISGAAPLETPAFRDSTAKPGRRYSYSVTAIDADRNESAPSAENAESLPPKP